jgi:fucose permease
VKKTNILAFPRVVLGAIAIFFYVGVEVIAGDTIGLYGEHLHLDNFATLTSYTMIFMVIGYALGVGLIPRYISQEKALLLSALAGIAFTVAILTSSQENHSVATLLWGWSGIATLPNSVTFVALLGLANALVWPTVWPLALDGLGKYTAQGSALLIMGIAGGALLPIVYGQFSEMFDMQFGYVVLFVGYGFILYYAVSGYKKVQW